MTEATVGTISSSAADSIDWESLGRFLRTLTLAALVIQLLGVVAAGMTHVMLHGDGSFFVFALGADAAWALKWRDIAARGAVYALTVVPTALIGKAFALGPMDLAALNGVIFFAVPLVQFAIAAWLAGRDHPLWLGLLLVQLCLAAGICYGFPSEILLAPGFLWIAAFLVAKGRQLSLGFLACYCGLIFSHELAVPAALALAYFAFTRPPPALADRPTRFRLLILPILPILALPLVAMILVRLAGGGEGSNKNAIFVIDPRRVLANPSLLLMLATVLILFVGARVRQRAWSPVALLVVCALAVLATLGVAALPWHVNFAAGRYDSRSIVAAAMFVLTLVFFTGFVPDLAIARWRNRTWGRLCAVLPPVLTSWLAIATVAAALFLQEWRTALDADARIVMAEASESARLVPVDEALRLMTPDEADKNARMGFYWVLPYRSFVIANGRPPITIIYEPAFYYRDYCVKSSHVEDGKTLFPDAALSAWRDFSCRQAKPPETMTISKRLFQRLKAWFGSN